MHWRAFFFAFALSIICVMIAEPEKRVVYRAPSRTVAYCANNRCFARKQVPCS